MCKYIYYLLEKQFLNMEELDFLLDSTDVEDFSFAGYSGLHSGYGWKICFVVVDSKEYTVYFK